MLTINNLYAGYTKDNPILQGLDMTIGNGEVVGVLGRNGSGKSTLAKAIFGMIPYVKGIILLDGYQIMGSPSHEIAKLGVGFFQQGGKVFHNLTVRENLNFATVGLKVADRENRFKEITSWFEVLQKPERLRMKASYLSGGEKHQLALAMVLVQNPNLLILDEPSAGLAPVNFLSLYQALLRIKESSVKSILVIEQNINAAADFCNKIVFLQEGKLISEELINKNK